MTILIIVGIIVLLGIIFASMYNSLVKLRNNRENAFADIDVQLKQRHDLIPQLVDTVKGYATVTPKQEKVTVTNKGEVKYGLFPVWFLNTKWNGKTYSFAMNGQTGRLIGDLPVGKDLAVKYWFKCHIPLTIAMTAIVTALRFMGVI